MIPVGDSPNPRGIPLITYGLILVNLAVYVMISFPLSSESANPADPLFRQYLEAIRDHLPPGVSLRQAAHTLSAYDIFVFGHGFRPSEPHPLDLLSSLFLHANLAHLFGNMLFLWIYGDNVEHRLGRGRYLFAYLATGVFATLFHAALDWGSPLPLIGASGAISGVLGFYFKWFPRNQVKMLVIFLPFIFRVIYLPARLVLAFYFLFENLGPLLAARGIDGGGVAYGAHIGGFVAGLVSAWILDRRAIAAAPIDFHPASHLAATNHVADLIAAGRLEEAAQRYFALPSAATRQLLSAEDSISLARWLAAKNHPHAALTVYRRHLRDFPRGPGRAAAHIGAGAIHLWEFGELTPAYQHFLEGLEANPTTDEAQLARRGLAAIVEQQPAGSRPEI